MKVIQPKKPKLNYLSYGGVVPFRTNCPYTYLPLSYSPVSWSRELLHPRKRKQFMDFCLFTHLLHRLSTTGSIPQCIYDPHDEVQLDSALFELNQYKLYQKSLEQSKEEKMEETSLNVESQESEEEGPEYSEESSRTDSRGDHPSLRRTSGRKRTRTFED
ncbi:hypothetical protein Gasu2_54010 [Galdieria sulphuraria]|uniref:Uncharacterized protein n=1 Tax=Galdieria sulphuraria TaxID=130081 RepID=M2XTP1_GALSU|nr:uncharacterized protein Gasu_55710 [Galdieria sulphuraria]EME26779.1 hypothetical protein Gasu_55710 [Galdieria sulphuraria]GJD11261.1 hypothetical protein Gasu2_54010 [Galdieria sulphuraria]|eukprot:XP_005703299.1 hypothetical protein Gasu_55710 [Galdieria sulphuraria]